MRHLTSILTIGFLLIASVGFSQITYTSNNPTCYGFADGSITVTIVGGESGFDISVTDTLGVEKVVGGSNAANNLTAQCYTVTVTDLSDGSETVQIICLTNPEQIDVDLDITHVLCHGDNTGFVEVDTVLYHQGPFSSVSYDWSSGPPGGLFETSDTLLVAGEYTLDLTDAFGCSASIVFIVEEPTPLEFAEIGYEPAYCRLYPYQVGNGQVFAAATGATPSYTYAWQEIGSVPLATSVNTTWGGLNPGDYEITVTDANGCTLTQIVTMDSVNPTAVLDITSAELNAQNQGTAQVCISMVNNSLFFANPLNPIADTSFWISIDHPTDPWHLYQDSVAFYTAYDTCYNVGGEYDVCLKIQNKNGCEDSVCHTITVWDPLSLTPPNIFTPDGDGVNDEFTFEYLSKGVKTFECTIVDRWGRTKATLIDFTDSWDGTNLAGNKCQDGVYFYTYSGTAENGDLFQGQGSIQIISSRP